MVAVNVPEVKEKPKKKKAAPKTQKKEPAMSADFLADIITGTSEVVACKPETAHWKISKPEAKTIADPLSRVIEKNENLKKAAEHSDSIALVMACLTVVAPRAWVSYNMMKEKKALQKRNKMKVVEKDVSETGKAAEHNGKEPAKHAPDGAGISTSVSDLILI